MSDANRTLARRWIEEAPFARELGVALESLDAERARLRLPFRERNANPGGALHGGVAASLALLGAGALARGAQGEAAAPWHTAGVQVAYLSAALSEAVVAEVELLRRGVELCFVGVRVETETGKPVASATALLRGRAGAPAAALAHSEQSRSGGEPGAFGRALSRLPFIAACGIEVETLGGGCARLAMPCMAATSDADGRVHEGALLALFDTAGAAAAWAEVGPGPHKASTPALQAQILAPLGSEDLVAHGRCVQRDRELLFCDVEVSGARSGSLVARGTVLYRIVT